MPDPAPNRGAMLVLAYLWPLAFVPFLVAKDDAEVQWHARHGIVLMAAELLLFLALGVVTGLLTLVTFGFGLAVSVLLYILSWTTILIVHIVAIIKALGGSRLDIPRVSTYASRF
jgi:uncharacterized membrane protein